MGLSIRHVSLMAALLDLARAQGEYRNHDGLTMQTSIILNHLFKDKKYVLGIVFLFLSMLLLLTIYLRCI